VATLRKAISTRTPLGSGRRGRAGRAPQAQSPVRGSAGRGAAATASGTANSAASGPDSAVTSRTNRTTGLFVPKAERHAHGLCRYCVYRRITVRWNPPASADDRRGCHSDLAVLMCSCQTGDQLARRSLPGAGACPTGAGGRLLAAQRAASFAQ